MNPVGIYLLKVNNRNTRTRCQICSKLTIKISADIDINFKIPDECRQFCGYRSDWRDCLDLKLYVFKNYSGDHKLFLKSLKIPGTFKKNINICDTLRNLVPFVKFKEWEKQPWRSVTFRPATLLKVTLLHGCFSGFLYCTNGTKLRCHIYQKILLLSKYFFCKVPVRELRKLPKPVDIF